jgi:hypothetical protein
MHRWPFGFFKKDLGILVGPCLDERIGEKNTVSEFL